MDSMQVRACKRRTSQPEVKPVCGNVVRGVFASKSIVRGQTVVSVSDGAVLMPHTSRYAGNASSQDITLHSSLPLVNNANTVFAAALPGL